MAVQVYTFKITYSDCDDRIRRIAAVSSNYTLAELALDTPSLSPTLSAFLHVCFGRYVLSPLVSFV